MSAVIQYDLFEPRPTEYEECQIDIKAVRDSNDKVRKKLFAENGELKKRMYFLEERLQVLERNICRS